MKIRTLSFLSIVSVIAGFALGGCKLYSNANNNTACSGYLGCSAREQVGINEMQDAGAGAVRPRHAINTGCGKPLPADQVPTVPGKPNGYTHMMVMGTGATLLANVPTKVGPRTFWVRVPVDYDPNHKYRTVYIGQGCGGYNVANTSTLQLFKEASGGTEQAIYVALDIPTDMANQDCYDNRDGPSSQEWEAFDLIHSLVDETYCVDNDRVYVSGYSTGGWLTDMWGCYFAGDGEHPWNGKPGVVSTSSSIAGTQLTSRAGAIGDAGVTDALMSEVGVGDGASTDVSVSDGSGGGAGGAAGAGGGADAAGAGGAGGSGPVFMPGAGPRKFAREYHIRGQMGVSGGEPDNNPPCNGPVGAIWIHDLMDSNVYSANHEIALPRVLKMNGCYASTPPTAPWHEDVMGIGVCVKYTACPASYPVVFCTTKMQGHADQHEKAIPGFKIFADEMETAAGLNKMAP